MSNRSAADNFGKQLAKAIEREVVTAALLMQKRIAFEALSRVVVKTPVDTGRARGNWQVGIDETNEDVPYEPIAHQPARRGRVSGFRSGTSHGKEESRSPAARANSRIRSVERPKIAGLRQLATVHIMNNVKYIQYIEDGSKTFQPPAAMVKNTVLELNQMFP